MKRAILILVILLLIAAGAFAFRSQLEDFGTRFSAPLRNPQSEIGPLVASGAIEVEAVSVGSVAGGRVAALHVVEGQEVAAGDLVAEMDTALLDAALKQAQATVAIAEAQLALLRAGARPADVAVARTAVAQADAARDAAYTAWQDALALLDAPGELDVKIATAEAEAKAADEQLAAAQASAAAADLEQQLWGRTVKSLEEGFDVPLPSPGGGTIHLDAPAAKLRSASLQWNLASQKVWEAHAKVNVAQAALSAARQTLADLRVQKQDPQNLEAEAEAAEAACNIAEATVAAAQADLDLLLAGASQEQLDAAEASVAQAKGAVQALEARRGQARIVAPEAGTVTAVVLRPGEVAAPGALIVRLADLSRVTLTVYVPEPELGGVRLGQAVQVMVDSFPGRAFPGTVTQVADRAEFTPKNVQTQEERANTVFAVKISVDNPDGVLKPGMPADAHFGEWQIADSKWQMLVLSEVEGAESGAVSSPESNFQLPISILHPPSSDLRSAIEASGTIEATETAIGAELGGRVVTVGAAEGDQVVAGQWLARLDEGELAAQISQAEAAVSAAQAELARIAAPPQVARVAKAKAQVDQAQAALSGAQAALANTQRLRENPLELDSQINSTRSQAGLAAAQVDLARAGLKAAQVLQESLPANTGSDQDRTLRAVYDQNVAAAQAGLRAAEAEQAGAQAALAQLLAIREKPVALEAAVHRAEGQVAQAQAALNVAQAALAQVQAPVQAEAIALAQARVRQAEAALALLKAQQEKLVVRSPLAGTVTAQAIHAGEVAQPGAQLYVIADLRQVKLVIYVPADRLGQVKLGEATQVTTDAYPGRVFAGTVTHIRDQAEFTPKNVQTQEERVHTVFAVEITLDNAEGLLKPGMPADARLSG